MKLILLLVFATVACPGCLPVRSQRITAGDLALADGRFRQLPNTLVVGWSPEPGARRVFAAAELARIAVRQNLPVEGLQEICFEVALQEVRSADLEKALRAVLPAQAELMLVEGFKTSVPVGDLVFKLSGLEPPARDGTQLWRGYVQYAETRKFNLCLRVRVTHRVDAVMAVTDLPANSPLTARSVKLEQVTLPLTRENPASSLEEVAGRILKQSLKAGAAVYPSALDMPSTVKRGDAVKVEVEIGSARLSFSAVAERAARDGDVLELRNPSSGKLFRAKLEGAKAVLRP